MRRSVKVGALLTVLVLAATACKKAPETEKKEPGVSLKISSPARGTAVKGNVIDLALEVSGINIVAAKDDPGTSGTGHFHVFIDKDPVKEAETIPSGQPDIVHSAANPIKLTGLSVGDHRLVVVLGDKTHVRIGDTKAETTVNVQGPSVDASGPATAKAGEAIKVSVVVQGVNIVAARDDKSNKDGTAGHLHVFVNKDPTAAGTPIPSGDPAIIHTTSTSIDIPADLLKAGENTLWVVLGYADHTPFDPPVLDKVIVTVS